MNSIRGEYEKFGVEKFYKEYGNEYKNPKEKIVSGLVNYALTNWDIGKNILDMCCGSGEVTKELIKNSSEYKVVGLDPFTYELYIKETGKDCINMNFDNILSGQLNNHFDTIFCSFALHLCEESKLQQVLWQLSLLCKNLIIITPHKRPDCNGISFELISEIKQDKCRIRLYKSRNYLMNME